MTPLPASIDATAQRLLAHDYVAEPALATLVFLALRLQRPLLLEGEPGTGKTALAKTLAAMLDRPLIRLQCHEGLDLAGAAYEWNHARQLLEIRLAEGDALPRDALAAGLFGERFLIRRALLQAIDPRPEPLPPVLLIDEIDRADDAFEAFLLELLSDFQITIPEFGTVRAKSPPVVVITSNRTREVHAAIKRRCLYHWVGFPDAARESAILARRVPEAPAALAAQVVEFVQRLRGLPLRQPPGIGAVLAWARTLQALDAQVLAPAVVDDTLHLLLQARDDREQVHDVTEASASPAAPCAPARL